MKRREKGGRANAGPLQALHLLPYVFFGAHVLPISWAPTSITSPVLPRISFCVDPTHPFCK
ncbi:hypothetical protein NPIL_499421, partial [Nephila pilipes]